jgi:hypothetical protein
MEKRRQEVVAFVRSDRCAKKYVMTDTPTKTRIRQVATGTVS